MVAGGVLGLGVGPGPSPERTDPPYTELAQKGPKNKRLLQILGLVEAVLSPSWLTRRLGRCQQLLVSLASCWLPF